MINEKEIRVLTWNISGFDHEWVIETSETLVNASMFV